MEACRSSLETDDGRIKDKPSPEKCHTCNCIICRITREGHADSGSGRSYQNRFNILSRHRKYRWRVLSRSHQTPELQTSFIDPPVHWELHWPVLHLNISCSNMEGEEENSLVHDADAYVSFLFNSLLLYVFVSLSVLPINIFLGHSLLCPARRCILAVDTLTQRAGYINLCGLCGELICYL